MARLPREEKLAPFNDIPIVVFTSALNKQRILEVLQQAPIRVYNSRRRRIPTSELNDYILPIIEDYPPASTKGKYIRIKYATQLPTPTPQFAFFVNLPQYIKAAIPPLSREQDTRALGLLGSTDADIFPPEITLTQWCAATVYHCFLP